jgi:hypothetical protein
MNQHIPVKALKIIDIPVEYKIIQTGYESTNNRVTEGKGIQ